jgi:hypothetical protein
LCAARVRDTKATGFGARRFEIRGRVIARPDERIFVGKSEACAIRRRDVANHPQRLWITLWRIFRTPTQVTYRKGIFFDRSNFERSVIQVSLQ